MNNYNSIYVGVRFRPQLSKQDEIDRCVYLSENVLQQISIKQQIILEKSQYEQFIFEFTQHFDQCTDQETLYLNFSYKLQQDVQKGISSNILIYGAQGSGKTYTMFGTLGSLLSLKQGLLSMDSGIIIRMIHDLHNQQILTEIIISIINNEQIESLSSIKNHLKWLDVAKQLQIILQKLYDMSQMQNYQQIHTVVELKTTTSSLIKIVQIGSISKNTSQSVVAHNKSIFTLHRCIQTLLNQQKQKKTIQPQKSYIPFRESKLTNLISNSFNGQADLKILLCLSPNKFDDALSTLQFGQLFQQIKIKYFHQKNQSQHSMSQNSQLNEFYTKQNQDMIPIQIHQEKIQELTDKYEAIIEYLQNKIIKYKKS